MSTYCQTKETRANLNGIQIIQNLRPKKARPVQKYIFLLLIANAFETETNPRPKTPRWPCGLYYKAVTWKHKAVCQGIPNHMYNIMNNSSICWHCIQCGMPNFTTSFFNSTTIETSNLFDSLSNNTSCGCIGSHGAPTAASSPITNNTQRTKPKQIKNKMPLKILNMNVQSLNNKIPDLLEIIDSVKPDIIMDTETWLDSNTSSYDYFPSNSCNVYRHDRPPNIKDQKPRWSAHSHQKGFGQFRNN